MSGWASPTALIALGLLSAGMAQPGSAADAGCTGTVYLTLDTGNMSQAERIAGILKAQKVKATFFLANEKTPRGDFALDPTWDGYWRERVAEGHAFGSHTFDHVYFRGSGGNTATASARADARPQFGAAAGRTLSWGADEICQEIRRVDTRFQAITGRPLDRLWRAPGGKAPPPVMRAASQCGYRHVFWAPGGFLGDELPSEKFPNEQLLATALQTIRDGDILMAHLGIWSRKDPYAPTLEPLIVGLKQRGLCFATLHDLPASAHPEAGKGN